MQQDNDNNIVTPSKKKHHKSVRSLTRDYEEQQPSPSSATSPSIHSTLTPTPPSHHHSRAPSVLLASPQYPSTLLSPTDTSPTRPRTVSGSSLSPQALRSAASGAIGIASASYPSSYSTSPSSASAAQAARSRSTSPANVITTTAQPDMSRSSSSNGLPTLSVTTTLASPVHEEEEEKDGLSELSNGSSSTMDKSAMTAAQRREHSRAHSKVHAKNLSVFFPRPGSEAEAELDSQKARETFSATTGSVSPALSLPSPGAGADAGLAPPSSGGSTGLSPSRSRRGHHRKHSVNHAMYDGQTMSVSPASTSDLHAPPSPYSSASPSPLLEQHAALQPSASDSSSLSGGASTHHAHAHAHAHAHTSTSSSPGVLARLASMPRSTRPLLVYGAAHFALGAALWVAGQAGDSLAMGGLGYLVVFDALGELCAIGGDWARAGAGNRQGLDRVYSPQRVETLLHFVQSIYLVFASVYVLKESIEHALLEGSEEIHVEDDAGLVLPTYLLLWAMAFGIFSAVVLQNHAKLVAACGISTAASGAQSMGRRGHGRKTSVLVDPSTLAGPFLNLLSNPFSLTVLFFSAALTFASVFMPPFQVAALDKVLAGLESAAMCYVAWPASKALGKVLLQTAPPSYQAQNVQLTHALKRVEEHPLVTYIAPPHLWQLTPPTSALTAASSGAGPLSSLAGGASQGPRAAKAAALVATVQVFLKPDASDADVLSVTRWAWQLAAPALGAAAGLAPGESLRGSLRAGELVVECKREGKETVHDEHEHDHHHHDHGHDHDHGHSHSHHGHSHGHDGHSHSHASHDHGSHSHGSHSHSHAGHSHSHAAPATAHKHDSHSHSHAGHDHASHSHGHAAHDHAAHSHAPHTKVHAH